MDRIKYRRMMAVYIADMKALEWEEPDIWNEMKMCKFSVQKIGISGTADHAGEQEVKRIKNRGGVKGITGNENSRTLHFLVSSVLAQIADEVEQSANPTSSSIQHHQLSDSYLTRRHNKVWKLVNVLHVNNFLNYEDRNTLNNPITGQIFSDEISSALLAAEAK